MLLFLVLLHFYSLLLLFLLFSCILLLEIIFRKFWGFIRVTLKGRWIYRRWIVFILIYRFAMYLLVCQNRNLVRIIYQNRTIFCIFTIILISWNRVFLGLFRFIFLQILLFEQLNFSFLFVHLLNFRIIIFFSFLHMRILNRWWMKYFLLSFFYLLWSLSWTDIMII